MMHAAWAQVDALQRTIDVNLFAIELLKVAARESAVIDVEQAEVSNLRDNECVLPIFNDEVLETRKQLKEGSEGVVGCDGNGNI